MKIHLRVTQIYDVIVDAPDEDTAEAEIRFEDSEFQIGATEEGKPTSTTLVDAGLKDYFIESIGAVDTPPGFELGPEIEDAGPRMGDHADWCCTKGCPNFDSKHITDEYVDQALSGTWTGGTAPLVDCPGTCTCDTGPRIDALRAPLSSPAVPDGDGGDVR